MPSSFKSQAKQQSMYKKELLFHKLMPQYVAFMCA